jgi:hypothetical protein
LQQEAVAFICRNMFQTPQWLLDKNILNKVSHPLITDGEKVGALQKQWLTLIISGGRLGRANIGVTRWGAANTITPYEILQTVHDEIWSELRTRKPTDNFRRNLQKSYISSITSLLDPANAPPGIDGLVISMSAQAIINTDIKAIALGHLTQLRKEVVAAIPTANAIDREHLQFVLRQINKALDEKK